jgi:acyl carrier protein
MDSKKISRNVYKVLRKTGIPRAIIAEDASFRNDMMMDENDMACFLYYLETNFNLNIENEAIPQFISVKSTINYLKDRYKCA